MSLLTLLTYIAIAAICLTALTAFALKHRENLFVSFLQNFTGALFIFSGYVKVVDPLGTAYKMEQYFTEFETAFAGTAMNFLAPIFPAMAEYSVAFSVFMIVLEIALGLALILGAWPRLTSWLFFAIVAFFTALTGFTYLTGYVPSGVNFFDFAHWGEYTATNMKVTDCGCFGDFIKLEPRTSFFKDIALLIPAVIFLFTHKRMHQLWTPRVRAISVGAITVLSLLYGMNNFVWDIPGQDFRPFRIGTDVGAQQQAEMNADASRTVLTYMLTNKETGEIREIPTAEFLTVMKDYPQDDWLYDTRLSEPAVARTKISDFEMSDAEGNNPIPALLASSDYTFFIVAYKLKGEAGNWDEDYLQHWTQDLGPVLNAALADGHQVVAATKYTDPTAIQDFKQAIGATYPFWQGDDIMLKTIIRSNPGVVLFKDGRIVNKWHHAKLPAYETIAESDLSVQ